MLDFTNPADAATAGRRRRGTDGIPAASAVAEPSQNCNYDQVTVIGRLAQGSPAISSLTQRQMWQELATKFANLYLGVIPCRLFQILQSSECDAGMWTYKMPGNLI